MNSQESYDILSPFNKTETCGKFTIDIENSTFTLQDIMVLDQDYVFGCWIKSDATGSLTIGGKSVSTSNTWFRVVHKFTATGIDFIFNFLTTGTYYIYHPKLEIGNIDTDWSPAPEDLGVEIDDSKSELIGMIGSANDTLSGQISDLNETVSDNNANISDLIETVTQTVQKVTNLEQTSEGWNFEFNELVQTVTQIDNEMNTEFTNTLKYIKFIDGEIWLGRDPDPGEDDFKVVISNERIRFLQNDSEVAYISNNQLYITNAEVTNRLDIGRFAFVPRQNGNLTLRYIYG